LCGQLLLGRFHGAQVDNDQFELGLGGGAALLEMEQFGTDDAEFALHTERSGLIGAAAGDHAALIAGAFGGNEGVLRVFAGELFGGGAFG
jgi:hypothetical protein